MRELDRTAAADSTDPTMAATAGGRRAGSPRTGRTWPWVHRARTGTKDVRIGLVGRGRVGGALARALREAGYEVHGPAGRGEVPRGDAILLCVPDAEIEAAAATVTGAASLSATRAARRGSPRSSPPAARRSASTRSRRSPVPRST
jgi:hypothetical protein